MRAGAHAAVLAVAGCIACFTSWTMLAGQRPPNPPSLATQLRRPVAAAYLDDDTTLCVAPQRSGSLSLLALPLPLAPREQCVLPGPAQVAVADAFGGQLAVVDASAGRLVALHELNAHNLRGLAVNDKGDQLLVSHQLLDQKAPTTGDTIARGVLMANVVRT